MAKEGDFVLIKKKDGTTFKGIVMPKTRLNAKDVVLLKLPDGYNIGIKKANIQNIKAQKKGKPVKHVPSKLKTTKRKDKKNVHIISVGGTIASRVDYKTGGVHPAFSAGDIVEAIPRLKNIANLTSSKISNILSEDITPKHWAELAKKAAKQINKGADGIVVMHGTDTMHYSSAMLSFMLRELSKPVVLVGAQRSSDRGSSDNVMNLLSAIQIAAEANIADVGVCMHGSTNDDYCLFHQGTRVRKMHSSKRDTFKSISVKPYLKVYYPSLKIEYLRKDTAKRSGKKTILDAKFNPKVGLIKSHPYINPNFIKQLSKYYDGLIIEGTGFGHLPTTKWDKHCRPVIKEVRSLVDSGMTVCMTSQTIHGGTNPFVYINARKMFEAGVIYLKNMLSEVAFVKLMWVLGHTKNEKKARSMMLHNYADEMTERSVIA